VKILKGNRLTDPTEQIRREMVDDINRLPSERERLEQKYGQVWSTDELTSDFEVIGFLAPFVKVRRRTNGREGVMMFQHSPRYYFSFKEE
jgi:hypothetical protein